MSKEEDGRDRNNNDSSDDDDEEGERKFCITLLFLLWFLSFIVFLVNLLLFSKPLSESFKLSLYSESKWSFRLKGSLGGVRGGKKIISRRHESNDRQCLQSLMTPSLVMITFITDNWFKRLIQETDKDSWGQSMKRLTRCLLLLFSSFFFNLCRNWIHVFSPRNLSLHQESLSIVWCDCFVSDILSWQAILFGKEGETSWIDVWQEPQRQEEWKGKRLKLRDR